MDLKEIRNNIDEIDDQLHSLIIKRMELSCNVAKCKLEQNMPVFNPERESEIVKRLRELSPKPYQDSVYSIYLQILNESKAIQRKLIAKWSGETRQKENGDGLKIACQGAKGSYSSKAANTVFEGSQLCFKESFNDVFESVTSLDADFGIVPIENSCAGSVTDNYDLLLKYDVSILKSVSLGINHQLLAKEGTELKDIKKVYSHPQALSQCSEFFLKNPQIEKCPFSNTATAAEFVANSNEKIAAIASKTAMKEYGLISLDDKVQDREHNFTRFAVIGKKEKASQKDGNITTMAVRLAHEPSALYKALGAFSKRNINMLRLQSRPIPACPFEFMFYIDIDGSLKDENVKSAIDEIKEMAVFLRVLGCYDEIQEEN